MSKRLRNVLNEDSEYRDGEFEPAQKRQRLSNSLVIFPFRTQHLKYKNWCNYIQKLIIMNGNNDTPGNTNNNNNNNDIEMNDKELSSLNMNGSSEDVLGKCKGKENEEERKDPLEDEEIEAAGDSRIDALDLGGGGGGGNCGVLSGKDKGKRDELEKEKESNEPLEDNKSDNKSDNDESKELVKKSESKYENAEVIGCVGEGSYGKCTCLKTQDNDFVVKKEVKWNDLSDKNLRKVAAKSIKEAKVLSSLDSEKIIKCYHSEERTYKKDRKGKAITGRDIYIELGYLNLDEYITIRKSGYFKDEISDNVMDEYEQDVFALVIYDIIKGLKLMHGSRKDNGVTQRDLKLANIIFGGDKNWKLGMYLHFWTHLTGIVHKLADFGICGTKRIMGTSTGTPGSMAPELATGTDSNKVDIWSLGIVIGQIWGQDFINDVMSKFEDEEGNIMAIAFQLNEELCNTNKLAQRFESSLSFVYTIMTHSVKMDAHSRVSAEKLDSKYGRYFPDDEDMREEMEIIFSNFLSEIQMGKTKYDMMICKCTNPMVKCNKNGNTICNGLCNGKSEGEQVWLCNNNVYHEENYVLCDECGNKRKEFLTAIWA
eukprot:163464_1